MANPRKLFGKYKHLVKKEKWKCISHGKIIQIKIMSYSLVCVVVIIIKSQLFKKNRDVLKSFSLPTFKL